MRHSLPVLEHAQVQETVATLERRILERFPDRNLGRVCTKLRQIGDESVEVLDWLQRPNLVLRGLVVALTLGLLFVVAIAVSDASDEIDSVGMLELLQVGEAAINDAIFVGIAIFFLWSIERRIKRARALRQIQKLRSIAHIVDMHQLKKDPARVFKTWNETPSSPESELTVFQLERYLDYCSEMLSLTGKLAVLYLENFDDREVLSSVNEVELLTTGLSRKIWQKLMILEASTPS